jgi:hypothetical protein
MAPFHLVAIVDDPRIPPSALAGFEERTHVHVTRLRGAQEPHNVGPRESSWHGPAEITLHVDPLSPTPVDDATVKREVGVLWGHLAGKSNGEKYSRLFCLMTGIGAEQRTSVKLLVPEYAGASDVEAAVDAFVDLARGGELALRALDWMDRPTMSKATLVTNLALVTYTTKLVRIPEPLGA